jgi:hypothetical protein
VDLAATALDDEELIHQHFDPLPAAAFEALGE